MKNNWLKMGVRASDLQQSNHYASGIDQSFAFVWGVSPISSQLWHYDGHAVKFYFDKSQHDLVTDQFIDKIHDLEFLRSFSAIVLEATNNAIPTSKSIHKQLKTNNKPDINQIFQQTLDLWDNFYPYAWSLWFIRSLEDSLKEKLPRHIPDNTEEIIQTLSYPTKSTPLSKFDLEILKISKLLQIDMPSALKKARQIANKYGWVMAYNFTDLPTSHEYIIKQARSNLEDGINPTQKMLDISKNRSIHRRNYHKIKSQINDPILISQLDLFHKGAYLRDKREETRDKLTLSFQKIYQQIGECLHLSKREITYLTNDEIIRGLSGQISSKILQKRAQRRQMGYLMIYRKGKCRIIDNPDKIRELTQNLEESNQSTDKITGQPAYVGEPVRGQVKIVLTNQDAKKVQKGDILVSSMTKPDYIAAMKLAAGFVTDEGGLLSHASIVAREMKKPCLIGTKIATSVLKDGDLIELDTQNKTLIKITCINRQS